jgi:hypothetical protein
MGAISLQTAQDRLQLYLDAEAAVLTNQSYEISGRKLTRADLSSVRAGIEYWDKQVSQAKADAGTCNSGRSSRLGSINGGW